MTKAKELEEKLAAKSIYLRIFRTLKRTTEERSLCNRQKQYEPQYHRPAKLGV